MTRTGEGRELLRLLRSSWEPIDATLRRRLIRYLEQSLPPIKRPQKKREPRVREWLSLRMWINERMAEDRRRLGDKYDEDAALNERVPGWGNQTRRSLRVLIAKKLRPHKAEVAQLLELWNSPD
jgi:hypothetical protein